MKIRVTMSCVDGTEMAYITSRSDDALDWLRRYDHEGSSVGVCVYGDNPDNVYGILRGMREFDV